MEANIRSLGLRIFIVFVQRVRVLPRSFHKLSRLWLSMSSPHRSDEDEGMKPGASGSQARGPIIDRLECAGAKFCGDGTRDVSQWLDELERRCALEKVGPEEVIAYLLDGNAKRVADALRVAEASQWDVVKASLLCSTACRGRRPTGSSPLASWQLVSRWISMWMTSSAWVRGVEPLGRTCSSEWSLLKDFGTVIGSGQCSCLMSIPWDLTLWCRGYESVLLRTGLWVGPSPSVLRQRLPLRQNRVSRAWGVVALTGSRAARRSGRRRPPRSLCELSASRARAKAILPVTVLRGLLQAQWVFPRREWKGAPLPSKRKTWKRSE